MRGYLNLCAGHWKATVGQRRLLSATLAVVGSLVVVGNANAHRLTIGESYANFQRLVLGQVREYRSDTTDCELRNHQTHLVCWAQNRWGHRVTMIHHRVDWNVMRVVFFIDGESVDVRYWRYFR